MKIHLRHPTLHRPACGADVGREAERTGDPDEVTCRRCLLTLTWADAVRARVESSTLDPDEAAAIRHALGYDSRNPRRAGARNFYERAHSEVWRALMERGLARGYRATEEGAREAGVLYAWLRYMWGMK
jgi:NAD-dependent oxidoreductase involved in siderophore biosynthesis